MKNEQFSFVFVNAWHDDNKGDSSIYEATLDLFQQRWPEAKLGLVSIISDRSIAYKTAYRHLQKRFPDLEITPSPFVSYDPLSSAGRYRGILTELPLTLLRLLPFFPKNLPALRLISQADLVVVNGGHYIYTHGNSLKSLGRLYRMLYPVLAARSYGVPYVFFAQSLGSFDDPGVSDRLAKFVLTEAKAVWPREEISSQNVLKLGVPKSKVSVIPDAAFALNPLMSENVKHLLSKYDLTPGQFWVVTVRQSPNGSEAERQARTESFLDQMAELIKKAIETGTIQKVALAVHVQGPDPGENDRIPTLSLARRLEGQPVTVIDEDLSPRELSAFYGCASLMIGTRFHSVIFSLVADTPAYAISYSGPKTWGIMRMLGMQELCSDLETFSAEKTLGTIRSVDLSLLSTQISQKVGELRSQLKAAIENINKIINN